MEIFNLNMNDKPFLINLYHCQGHETSVYKKVSLLELKKGKKCHRGNVYLSTHLYRVLQSVTC